MTFDENMLAAIAALGRHIMDIAEQAEVDRNAKIDLMQKVCSLECELEELKAKINTAHLMLAGASANGSRVANWADSLRKILK